MNDVTTNNMGNYGAAYRQAPAIENHLNGSSTIVLSIDGETIGQAVVPHVELLMGNNVQHNLTVAGVRR